MDKVIIGEVDVSECKYCASGYFCNKPMSKQYCYENTDCEYKQLQRAKAEIEKPQKENDILRQYRGSKQASYENMQSCWQESEKARRKLEKENKQLKAENEKLKEEIKQIGTSFIAKGDMLREVANSSIIEQERLVAQVNRLSQCLKEIKEIAKADVHIVGDEKFYYDVVEQILAKINEVIGAE